ncbi:MAG: hypothetical protein AAGC60_00115 [Acidobacteriota bacterium]
MKPQAWRHPKFRRALRRLREHNVGKAQLVGMLELMWHHGYEHGARIGDGEDLADVCDWLGGIDVLVDALATCGDDGPGFLQTDSDGVLWIHDLADHAPEYAFKRMLRDVVADAGLKGDTAAEVAARRAHHAGVLAIEEPSAPSGAAAREILELVMALGDEAKKPQAILEAVAARRLPEAEIDAAETEEDRSEPPGAKRRPAATESASVPSHTVPTQPPEPEAAATAAPPHTVRLQQIADRLRAAGGRLDYGALSRISGEYRKHHEGDDAGTEALRRDLESIEHQALAKATDPLKYLLKILNAKLRDGTSGKSPPAKGGELVDATTVARLARAS